MSDHHTGRAQTRSSYRSGPHEATLLAMREGLGARYEIEGVIGEGGMAVVYAARDQKHARRVAIKVLRQEAASAFGAERFLREIEIIAGLTHPNILALHDSGMVAASGSADPLLYYVTPLLEGDTLRSRLQREGTLDVMAALQIGIEIADALGHAHARGVVHRDVKPENILFQANHAIVADFGIARSSAGRHITATGIAVGTFMYMSPEQRAGDREIDGRTDVYSLACVIAEMVTGRIPRGEADLEACFSAVGKRGPSARAMDRLKHVLSRCLALAPEDRYPDAREFEQALATIRAASPRVRVSRARLAIAGLVAIAVAGIAFGITQLRAVAPRIIVVPFTSRSSDVAATQAADAAADWVTREIARVQEIPVIPMSTAREVWAAAPPASRDPAGIARASGADVLVAGTFARIGPDIRFDVEIVDARRNRLIAALAPVIAPLDSPALAATRLSDRVAGALVARFTPRPIVERGSDPPSVPAFEQWQLGLDAFARREWEESVAHFRSATEIDSTYAPPMLWAATAYLNLSRFATSDSLLRALRPMLGRLMPVERVNFEWVSSILRGDKAAQLRWGKEGFDLEPGTWSFPYGHDLLAANQPHKALEILGYWRLDTPFARNWMQYWEDLARAKHLVGDYGGELDVAVRWRARSPAPTLRLVRTEARALVGLGRLAEVDSLLQLIATLLPDGEGQSRVTPAMVVLQTAEELRDHGQASSAKSVAARVVERSAAGESDAYTLARLLYVSERWDEALAIFDSLARSEPENVRYVGSLGATYARMNRAVDAARADSQLAAIDRPFLRGANTMWRARIAAVMGDSASTTRLVMAALAAGFPIGAQLHADMDFAAVSHYAPFQRILKPSG